MSTTARPDYEIDVDKSTITIYRLGDWEGEQMYSLTPGGGINYDPHSPLVQWVCENPTRQELADAMQSVWLEEIKSRKQEQ